MPLFMDRHYIEGALLKTVGKAHHEDIEKFNRGDHCKALTHWHDEERAWLFVFVEAISTAVRRDHKKHTVYTNQNH